MARSSFLVPGALLAVGCSTLGLTSACGNDFDALFLPRADGGADARALPGPGDGNDRIDGGDKSPKADAPGPVTCGPSAPVCGGSVSTCNGAECTNTCDGCCDDCALSCGASAGTCDTLCKDGANCTVTCKNSGTCDIVANRARSVHVLCNSSGVAGVCSVDCTDSNSCEVECGESLFCDVTCTRTPCIVRGAEDADVDCGSGAGEPRRCPGNIVTCNRDCP